MMNMLTKTLSISILIALIEMTRCSQLLPDDISMARYNTNKIPVNYEIYSEKQLISLRFPSISFQISSQFYIKEGNMDENSVYNKSAYSQKYSYDCYLFPTDLQLKIVNSIPIDQDYKLSILKYHVGHSDKKGTIHILSSDSRLLEYMYDPLNIKLIGNYSIDPTYSNVVNGVLTQNVEILKVNDQIFFFTPRKAYKLKNSQFGEVQGYDLEGNKIQKAALFNQEENTLWVSTDLEVVIFKVDNNQNFKVINKIKGFSNQIITTVSHRLLSNGNNVFYIVTIDVLYIIPQQNDGAPINQYKLNGSCTQSSIIKDTLFVSCDYQHINYIIEIQLNEYEAKLNRFYNDLTVQGARKVIPIGYDKIGVIGDENVMILGQAVNRHVLLDLAAQKIQQRKRQFYSPGLMDLVNLKEYSSQLDSCVMAINKNQLSIIRVVQDPPQLQCFFERSQVGASLFILAAFNTTHCPYSLLDNQTLGGTYLICQTLSAYQLSISQYSLQQKTANLFFFFITLQLIFVILICVGCGFKIHNKTRQSMRKMHEQIKRLKRKRQESNQLQQI